MSKTDDFAKRIAAAKLDLNTALLTGSPTAALRGALRALESEKAAIDAAAAERQANQDAAQQALATIERDNDHTYDQRVVQQPIKDRWDVWHHSHLSHTTAP